MSSQWLLFIFLVLAIIFAADITRRAFISIIDGSNEKRLRLQMRQLRRPKQPWVTVLVYGKNQAVELEKTVRQVRQSRYSQYDIVAVSDRSEDTTALRMKGYIAKTNQRVKIQFLQRRIAGTKMEAYRAAYRKSQRGKIIVCLTAGDEVTPLLLKQAVLLQANKQSWRVGRRTPDEPYGLIGLVKNMYALFWRNNPIAWVYTPITLRQTTAKWRSVNNSLVFICTQVLFIGVVVSAVLYAGFIALWYAWVLFSLYLFALTWTHYETPIARKWKVTFAIPSALFLIPAVGLVEGFTQLRIRK